MAREFGTDDEAEKGIQRINALLPESRQFLSTTARKDHLDLFDVLIAKGEIYWKRGYGFNDVVRLSQKSMDRLCVAILFDNIMLEQSTDRVLAQRAEKAADIVRAIHEIMSNES